MLDDSNVVDGRERCHIAFIRICAAFSQFGALYSPPKFATVVKVDFF